MVRSIPRRERHRPLVLTFREQVRPDAAQTLAYFRAQGVGIRVISGDNPRTVAAIAREVGLDVAEGFDARRLPEDDAELGLVLEKEHVFGRVTPEQKKRMVVALQGRGHTVAMTGDGVNDALAIKTADIGIAMNSGTAATQDLARLVLLDGQFSHLPDVVAEGRQVIANIERVSMLFLTKTAYATGLAIRAVLFAVRAASAGLLVVLARIARSRGGARVWTALLGAIPFWTQTALLDALVWPAYWR